MPSCASRSAKASSVRRKIWPRKSPKRSGPEAKSFGLETRKRDVGPRSGFAGRSPPMTDLRLCAVSVDLDEIPNYFGIHGLAEPEGPASTLVYDVAIDRLLALAKEVAISLTLFAIGRDLSRTEAAAKLRAARVS